MTTPIYAVLIHDNAQLRSNDTRQGQLWSTNTRKRPQTEYRNMKTLINRVPFYDNAQLWSTNT